MSSSYGLGVSATSEGREARAHHEEHRKVTLDEELTRLQALRVDPSQLAFVADALPVRGGFAEVYLDVPYTQGGNASAVVVKKLKYNPTAQNDEETPEGKFDVACRLVKELSTWYKLSHRNILELTGFYLSEDYVQAWLISPYLPTGSILSYISSSGVGELLDVAAGLGYLHQLAPPIWHGDVKPSNILVKATFNRPEAVLCDFGATKAIRGHTGLSSYSANKHPPFTLHYANPELLRDSPYGPATDVWAWGCSLLQIVTKNSFRPWGFVHSSMVVTSIHAGAELPGRLKDMDEHIKLQTVKALLRRCWQEDPTLRPSMEESIEVLQRAREMVTSETVIDDADPFIDRDTQVDSSLALEEAPYKALQTPHDLRTETYLGWWKPGVETDMSASSRAAVKAITATGKSHLRLAKDELFWSVSRRWRAQNHPNVLPFIGYLSCRWKGLFGSYSFIVPFRQNGNILEYMAANPSADKLKIMLQVCHGVQYLHEQTPPVFHCDLKPTNILITGDGVPQVADWQIRYILTGRSRLDMSSMVPGYVDVSFAPPEALSWSLATERFDIFSAGRVLSGFDAWYHLRSSGPKMEALRQNTPLERGRYPMDGTPKGFDALWELLERTFETEPSARPTIREFAEELDAVAAGLKDSAD